MSGICGIANFDAAPVDQRLLSDLTAFMAYRGPDAQDIRVEGSVGFGHAMLRTTIESEHERQPWSLDGKVWITADARIDARDELKRALEGQGRGCPPLATDAELILHAYHAWGKDCVNHLLGDFAFAIWDAPRQELFCARDHFGVKPFFYALLGRRLVFSNTLNCVRRHPAVSTTLDDLAIADFLLFEIFHDPARTAFADIRRLPPAHCMSFSGRGLQTGRYWSLPRDARVQYRDAGDYVERFRELLGAAVADRLRAPRAGVLMSGGLDSAAIAATAFAHMSRQHQAFELRAHTIVYDRLIPDEERHYSGLVARKIGIPIHYVAGDDYRLFERYRQLGSFFAEPANEPHAAVEIDLGREAAAHARVMLTGWDGDALLNESPRHYFGVLLKEGHWGRLLASGFQYALKERKLVPQSLMRKLNPARPGNSPEAPSLPPWLNADFEKRLDLRERWIRFNAPAAAGHPIRPYAHRSFTFLTQVSNFFDRYDAGCTRLPLEYRHPLLDLRLIEYSLSLPPFPWCVKKEILRRSMRGLLPEAVRLRPKAPLAGFPYVEILRREGANSLDPIVASEDAGKYIDATRVPPAWMQLDPDKAWVNLRPYSLDLWLRNVWPHQVPRKESCHEFA
jgi:asparagine synthase (glutamine-hydrolysing)